MTHPDCRTESLRHLADALAPGGFLLLAASTLECRVYCRSLPEIFRKRAPKTRP